MRALVFLVIAASTAAACNAVLGIDEGHLIADDAGAFTGGEDARRTDADTSDGGVEDDAAQGKDASDASVADQAAPGVVVSIPTLRNPSAVGHPVYGARVTVTGLVVGLDDVGANRGFYLRDTSQTVWAGVYAYTGGNAVTVAVGDVVTATGNYSNYQGADQLQVTGKGNSYAKTGSGGVPAPLNVTLAELSDCSATGRAAQLQSMLVKMTNVVTIVATVNTEFTVKAQGDASADTLIVSSFVANEAGLSPFPSGLNQKYASIVGYAHKSGNPVEKCKLAPRNAADLVLQ